MQITTPVSDELGRYLDLASAQLKVTAENMANVDTPGYRARGFDFAGEMRRSMGELLQARGSGEAPEAEQPALSPVDGLLERPDGNNVSMDREGLNLAEAQLKFRTGVELLKREYSMVMSAIHADTK